MALVLNSQMSGHNDQSALYLATACDLAYLPQEQGKVEFAAQLGLAAKLISVDNTQCYVCENDQVIVVAFRGSEIPNSIDGFKDWLLTNAKNFLVLPAGKIGTDFVAAGVGARFHRGFMEALDEIWEPLFQVVDAILARQDRPVFITGHSLGGALALLSAWRLQRQMIPIHNVYTFGAPMVGNEAAAKAFEKEFPGRIYRYVDAGDMVPHLPTVSMFSNEYWHCLTEIVVGASAHVGESLKALASGRSDASMTQAAMEGVWTKATSGIQKHLMGNYIAQINGLKGGKVSG
jgi:triacylglycerol lipase